MEILVEIEKEEAERFNINADKLTFKEFRRKIALSELKEALQTSQEAAKRYGLDEWTMDDVNNMIAEAKADYNDKSGH